MPENNEAYINEVYVQGYRAGRKSNGAKNLVKSMRRLLWFSIECALVLSIFKGCFG